MLPCLSNIALPALFRRSAEHEVLQVHLTVINASQA